MVSKRKQNEAENASRETVRGIIVQRPEQEHSTYLAVVNPQRVAPASGASRPDAPRRHGYRMRREWRWGPLARTTREARVDGRYKRLHVRVRTRTTSAPPEEVATLDQVLSRVFVP